MTTSEALVAKIENDLANLNASISKLVDEYKIAVEQALRLEASIHELTKSMGDCAGQNCHACANMCEKFTEVEDVDQAEGN